jgi:hypothetical protein
MKKANQIKVNNRVRTVNTCSDCGATTHIKAGINTKTAQQAIERSCKTCNPTQLPLNKQGWWLEFGLDKNPYVYGPMQRLRTGRQYRIEEARPMGWMAWTWNNEYSSERKGLIQTK